MKNTGKEKKFKYKRVKIYWIDIVSNSEWMSLEKAKDQVYSICEDTGYLLYKDQKKLIIFASHSLMMMAHLQLEILQYIQDQ